MLLFLFYLASAYEKDKDSILVCYSNNTPPNLLELFSDFTLSLNLTSNTLINQVLLVDFVLIIIDITKDSNHYSKLDQLSQQFNTFYITITPPSGETTSSLRFHLHAGQGQLENAVSILLDFLKWEEFSLFGSSQINNQALTFSIRSKFNQILNSFIVYDKEVSDEKCDEIVRKLIKAQGIRNLLVVDDGSSLSSFQRALKSRKIPKFGIYLVFLIRAIYTIDIEGALIISEPGTEGSTSEESFEFLTILNFLQSMEITSLTYLKNKCPNQICLSFFNLVNIQQGKRKIIGKIEKGLDIFEQPVFPENNTSIISTLKKFKIVVSIANGTSEIYNQGYFPVFAYWYQGARYAVSRSNLLKEFENFELELFPTDCGNFLYDENWYKICLGSVINNLGVAYLTSYWSAGSMGNLLTLRSLSKNILQISPFSILKELESKSSYPEFITLGLEQTTYAVASHRFLINLKWFDIILYGSDDELFYNQYKTILKLLQNTRIKIINPENLAVFPANYTRDQFEKYKEIFEFAKKSRCRIFLFSTSVSGYIIEGLYDIGLRKGDFIAFGDASLFQALEDEIDKRYMKKREELLLGSLLLGIKEWGGEYGQNIKNELLGIFKDITNMCGTYDSLGAVKYALQHILITGEDYEDTVNIDKSIRNQRFIGCLGSVYFKSEANYRESSKIEIQQIYFNKEENYIGLKPFVEVNIYSSILLTYTSAPEWPEGESTPTNYIEYSECGFDERLVVDSKKGQSMIFIISSILLIISVIFSLLSWKYFKNSYKDLEEKKEMNLNDYIYLIFFVFEFFEFVSLGPKNGVISFAFNKTEFLLAIDFSNYFDFTYEKFWMLYAIILAVAYTFIFLSLLALIFRREVLEKNYFLMKIQDLSDSILPMIGHIGFLPLISLLLNILICEKGVGENLEESYLERDCSQFCYTGKHKKYLTAGIIAAAGFLSAGCFLRPYWETIQYSLNLRTKVWYLSVLSVFQTLCVVCRKCLKAYSEAVTGFIISIIIGILILITAVKKPYNYSRVVVYQLASLSMSFWTLLISSIYMLTSRIILMALILFIGLFLIFCLGLLVSLKHPKLFISNESNPIPGLIRFQFTGKIEYLEAKSNFVIEEKKDFHIPEEKLDKE